MSDDPTPSPQESYADAAGREDDEFDRKIAGIRNRQDAGLITIREAADLRVAAMEAHLAELRRLREVHFGGGFLS